jgi:hypothetical protein
MKRRIPLFVALVCLVLALSGLAAGGVRGSDDAGKPPPSLATAQTDNAPVMVHDAQDVKNIDDPDILQNAGRYFLSSGQAELARACFSAAWDRSELARWMKVRPEVKEALILERMGDLDASTANWHQAFADDVLYAAYVLRAASVHPDRDALFDQAMAEVRKKVEQVEGGESPVIYTTTKGEQRSLARLDQEELLARVKRGEEIKYVWIPSLDLSAEKVRDLPPEIVLDRVVVGSVRIPDRHVGKLVLKGIVLGDLVLGKTWEGAVNASRVVPASDFVTLDLRDTIVLGSADLQDVHVTGPKAYFPLTDFERGADFRGMRIDGVAEFRYAVFGDAVNFKGMRLAGTAYLGNSHFRKDTVFTGLYSEQRLYFNSAWFEGATTFDGCEWIRGATFENSAFDGPSTFAGVSSGGRLNFSRTRFRSSFTLDRTETQDLDFLGAQLQGKASFQNDRFKGEVRFAPPATTMAEFSGDPAPLYRIYRDYQGDEDADEPLSTKSAYGVERTSDLVSSFHTDVSFANSAFDGFALFGKVSFGEDGQASVADFYNTQFKGETHFEEAEFRSAADFTSIFAYEMAFNGASFFDTLNLDDANIPGRLTLTDARMSPGATISLYGVQIVSFNIDMTHILDTEGEHRLAYDLCARSKRPLDARRQSRLGPGDPIRLCTERAVNEYVTLKAVFDASAMSSEADYCYWWIKHHQMRDTWFTGGFVNRIKASLSWLVFEKGFGWGVRLVNIGYTGVFMTFLFALLYRLFFPDARMNYNGEDKPVRAIPFAGLLYIALQSLLAINVGWDFEGTDTRFRYLSTLNTVVGVILLTFFVGAYTRMVLS